MAKIFNPGSWFIIVSLFSVLQDAYDDVMFEDREICQREFKLWKMCNPNYRICLVSGKDQCHKELESCMKRYSIEQPSHTCGISIYDFMEKLIADEPRTLEQLSSNALNNLLKENKKESYLIYEKVLNISEQSNATDPLISRFLSLASNICNWDNLQNNNQCSKTIFSSHIWYGGISNDACWKEVDQSIVREYCGKDSMEPINHVWVQYHDCKASYGLQCFPNFKKQLYETVNASSKRLLCKDYFRLIINLYTYLEIDGNNQPHYEKQYLSDLDLRFLESESYNENTVYLYKFKNDDVYKYCTNNIGEASFCMISRYNCLQNRSTISVKDYPDDCDSNAEVCINNINNAECQNEVLTEIGKDKSFRKQVIWLIVFIWNLIFEIFKNWVVKMGFSTFAFVLFQNPVAWIMVKFFDWSTKKMQCIIDDYEKTKSKRTAAQSPTQQHLGNNSVSITMNNNENGEGVEIPFIPDESVPVIRQDPNFPSQSSTTLPTEGKAPETPKPSDKKYADLAWEFFETFCSTFKKLVLIFKDKCQTWI